MNAYNKGSDEQYYLSMFNGRDIIITQNTAAIHANEAVISLARFSHKLSDLLTASRFDSICSEVPVCLSNAYNAGRSISLKYNHRYERIITGIKELSGINEPIDIPKSSA